MYHCIFSKDCLDILNILKSYDLEEKEEVLLFTGQEFAKVRDPDEQDGLHQVPAKLPFAFYGNANTGTYSILEYHKAPYSTYCIIAYGTELKPVPETIWMFQQ